jgi:hypothetical protein
VKWPIVHLVSSEMRTSQVEEVEPLPNLTNGSTNIAIFEAAIASTDGNSSES